MLRASQDRILQLEEMRHTPAPTGGGAVHEVEIGDRGGPWWDALHAVFRGPLAGDTGAAPEPLLEDVTDALLFEPSGATVYVG